MFTRVYGLAAIGFHSYLNTTRQVCGLHGGIGGIHMLSARIALTTVTIFQRAVFLTVGMAELGFNSCPMLSRRPHCQRLGKSVNRHRQFMMIISVR